MAKACMGNGKNDQLANHIVSSAAQHEWTCTRCGGLMVTDFCIDALFCSGEKEFAAKRCVQCGEVVDPVILRNRATSHEAMMAPRARMVSI